MSKNLSGLVTLRIADVDPAELTGICFCAMMAQLLSRKEAGLRHWPIVTLEAESATRFSHGNPVFATDAPRGWARVYGPTGRILGLGEGDVAKQLKPKRIFNLEKG